MPGTYCGLRVQRRGKAVHPYCPGSCFRPPWFAHPKPSSAAKDISPKTSYPSELFALTVFFSQIAVSVITAIVSMIMIFVVIKLAIVVIILPTKILICANRIPESQTFFWVATALRRSGKFVIILKLGPLGGQSDF